MPSPAPNVSLSILIPNYNGRELLERFLPYTLTAAEEAGIPYELIVIDDASTDDSIGFLRSHYPQIRLIENQDNLGFARTCNRGIRLARYTYTCLLNSDIQLPKSYFRALLNETLAKPSTFGIMGTLRRADGQVEFARKRLVHGSKGIVFRDEKQVPDKISSTAFLSGANAIYQSKKLKELDGFNPIFSPYYYEDAEMGLRAAAKGWSCYVDSRVHCYHLGSETILSCHKKRTVKTIYFRNRLLMRHLHDAPAYTAPARIFLLEVLPKWLIGQFWIWKSFRSFLQLRQATDSGSTRKWESHLHLSAKH
ncbi:glycosyl transferase family protein [Nitritalea halalkaliphila LW7]|uniref:Glycosyl transferase family protein n=1 Tax=Nitritalea halalkaliphila LW7 TaxID=1189621 RepID=I5BTM0_9BACT|nr:glycosyltransferase family 2 protein [Nitritalea halalkaliphila]EIM72922.1 glycosyl transferase family protein [Nitritalea halalkaliphila LW7]